jgi:transcriptional regulator with XRE-family HTH domain
MNIGLILSDLIEKKKVRKTELARYLDVARNTLDDYLFERTYMTTEKLEKVADFFKVPVAYFFEEKPKGSITQEGEGNTASIYGNISLSDCQKEVEHLRELLEEKERAIQDKERTIQILMNKN